MPQPTGASTAGSYRLEPRPRGALVNLVPVSLPDAAAIAAGDRACAPGTVLLAVKAVGINFRDVLNVLGMYPGDPGAPGGDCAGTIAAVGPQAADSSSSLRAGQAVFGLAVGSLGTAVQCSASTMVAMPGSLSFETASSMPTVFMTAQLATMGAAGCREGEAALVHAAAGGVGLAALQVLTAAGVRAVATASSPSKRSLLRSLGVSAVVGSRDSVFVGPVSCLGGVDVVLNSLTSPGMVGGSLAVLKQGGRVVEIGKRDIWAPAAVAADRPDVCFSLLAVDFLPGQVVQSALQRVAAGVAAGRLLPLPIVCHNLASAAAALRQLSQVRIPPSSLLCSNPSLPAFRQARCFVATPPCPSCAQLIAYFVQLCSVLIKQPIVGLAIPRANITAFSARAVHPCMFVHAGLYCWQGGSFSTPASMARTEGSSIYQCWCWQHPHHRRHWRTRPPGGLMACGAAGRGAAAAAEQDRQACASSS
jgi:NADPH:quinone reductase-like Zn-dependent oxidoreductase